jgi:hypothetical protein
MTPAECHSVSIITHSRMTLGKMTLSIIHNRTTLGSITLSRMMLTITIHSIKMLNRAILRLILICRLTAETIQRIKFLRMTLSRITYSKTKTVTAEQNVNQST